MEMRVRDQIIPILRLLQPAESHLGAGDVLLRVLEVFELYYRYLVSQSPPPLSHCIVRPYLTDEIDIPKYPPST